jgi:hypothetical protein
MFCSDRQIIKCQINWTVVSCDFSWSVFMAENNFGNLPISGAIIYIIAEVLMSNFQPFIITWLAKNHRTRS